jgi:hypothetical protein
MWHLQDGAWSLASIGATRVTGSAADDVFALSGGRLYHFDGENWEAFVDHLLFDRIWTLQDGSTVAQVLNGDSLYVWTGGEQSVVEFYFGFVESLWGTSPDHMIAVGGGVASRRDGVWDFDSTPLLPGRLKDISGSSRDNLIAVGFNGTAIHFDGTAWTRLDLSTEEDFHSVWAQDPRVAYVAGTGGALFKGTPSDGFEPVFDYQVAGTGPLWVESESSMRLWDEYRSHVLENGVWRLEGTNQPNAFAVGGRSPDDIFALGPNGVRHFDGERWAYLSSPFEYSSGDLHVLPDDQLCIVRPGRLYTYDGGDWQTYTLERFATGVWASSLDDVWIAGFDALVHFDGSEFEVAWEIEPSAVVTVYVWGRGPADVFAIRNGAIAHYNGSEWRSVEQPGLFRTIIGNSRFVVAIGPFESALFDGDRWRTIAPLPGSLRDAVVGLDGHVYALVQNYSSGLMQIFRME